MNNEIFSLFKRCFDFISALVLFLFLLPLFILIFLLVRLNMGKPALFKQVRSGRNQKIFTIIKFRTMTNTTDEKGTLLSDEKRQTRFGSFLRTTSLDELPELLSIIKGEMSVIGPRPLPTDYDDYYTEYEKKRFKVRPGLIPPDSIYGGVELSWDEQLECEAEYAEKLCLRNDIRVFFAVFKTLFNRSNSNYGVIVRKSLIEERRRPS